MANTRNIKERIKSVESTSKITKSMKMVSAAKLHRTQNMRGNLSAFSEKCESVLKSVISAGYSLEHPLMKCNDCNKTCYVLFVGNRGLCGGYNTELLKFFQTLEADDSSIIVCCGRWGKETVASLGIKVIKTFDEMNDTPSEDDAKPLADYLKELYLNGECSEILLVYQRFENVLTQIPTVKKLLPLTVEKRNREVTDLIFEPDKDTLVDGIVDLYFDNTVYSALIDAKAGEHAARLTAMTSASDSTEKLIAQLTLQLNHARQSTITTEISEVAGGANALNKVDEYE